MPKAVRVTQRGFVTILLIIPVLILVLGGVGYFFFTQNKSTPEAEQPKYSGPKEKFRIANIGEYSILNLVAQDQGYFSDFGIEEDIKEYESGPPAMTALLKDEVDVAVAAEFVGMRNIFNSKNLRIISQSSKHQVFHMLARTDKGITKESDLKGKKVGVTRKSAGEFFLGRFLSFNNLSLGDIKMVDLPPAEMVKQIESGEVDAIVIFDPHAFNIQKKLAEKLVTWSAQGDQKTFAIFYSKENFIKTNPDLTKRYLQALFKAEQFIKESPKEAQSILASTMHYQMEYIEYIWPNFSFGLGLNQELLITMEDQARWLIDNKLVEQTQIPNYLDYIYFDGLDATKPTSITIIR